MKKKKIEAGWRRGLIFLAAIFFAAIPLTSQATIQVSDDTACQTLTAGQWIDAGEVCSRVQGEFLVVTYTTQYDWELTEAHLWIGLDLADMPQNRKGNPKIGNFPYASGDITGATSYAFNIPLDSLGSVEELCDVTAYLAAHAAVRREDGNGGYQTETGWSDGDPIVDQGSWAMYSSILFECKDDPEPPPVIGSCETAFAFGDMELDDFLDTARWGWQITVNQGDSFSTPVYAGAGQNDISKGTHVGELDVSYEGNIVSVSFNMLAGFAMDETHVYVGDEYVSTAAPGLYGNLHDLTGAFSDDYTLIIDGSAPYTLYIVAHAVVCGEFE